MSSTYGENLKLSIFGQSHSSAVGMVLDCIPAGLPVDMQKLQSFLNRRAPGQNDLSTSRTEADKPEFLGGILDGFTCGAPIAGILPNKDIHPLDYDILSDIPRPGHSDFTAQIKYGGYQDRSGGGHFSGRLTAPMCIAGGLCKQWLEQRGIQIAARIEAIGACYDMFEPDPLAPPIHLIGEDFPVFDPASGERMRKTIMDTKAAGDSIGGTIQCFVTGAPAGLGEPMFGGVESRIAQITYGIPGVKCVEFGTGHRSACMYGSESNDHYCLVDGIVRTTSNHCGGILGGITNGMPLIFCVTMKPTPSISLPQQSISLSRGESTLLQIKGRHDPCIVPRAVPVVEAAAAIAVYDMILGNTQTPGRK